MVGEEVFREDQNLSELIGGLQSYSKELVPLSQPKTHTCRRISWLDFQRVMTGVSHREFLTELFRDAKLTLEFCDPGLP